METPKQHITVFIIISLVLHLTLFWFAQIKQLPSGKHVLPHKETVKVFLKPAPLKKKGTTGTMVDLAPQKPTDEPVESKYLSDRNSKVEEQTRARVIDHRAQRPVPHQTVKRTSQPKKSKKGKVETDIPSRLARAEDSTRIRNELEAPPNAKDLPRLEDLFLSPQEVQSMFASSDNQHLPEVKEGEVTRLNTQLLQIGGEDGIFGKDTRFHSYFKRIRDSVAMVWNPRSALQKAERLGENTMGDLLSTTLYITLNADGSLQSIYEQSSSGVRSLDDEAKRSFKESGPFSNPPKELIDNWVVKRRILEIYLPLSGNSSGQNDIYQMREEILNRYERGAPFETLAQQYSRSQSSRFGGDLGLLTLAEFPESYRDAVVDMHEHEVRTIYLPDGIHILYLREIKDEGYISFPFRFNVVQSH